MKQHILVLIILFLIPFNSNAQGFQEGYLTFKDSTTIIASVLIKINGRHYIHYEKKKKNKTKIVKIKKSKLLDFGIIEDGKKQSKYAEFRFETKAFDAFYIKNATKDTVHFYFLEKHKNYIKGFSKKGKQMKLSTKHVSTVFVKDKFKTIIYDAVNISQKKKTEKYLFLERKLDGIIKVYPFSIKKVELIKWLESIQHVQDTTTSELGLPVVRHTMTRITPQYDYINGNILVKENLKDWFLFDEKGIQSENKLRTYINDCAFVNSALGTKGYQIEDIYIIIKKYNELRQDENCH
jgi:hypothetical protein